jgi:hypothetical protein
MKNVLKRSHQGKHMQTPLQLRKLLARPSSNYFLLGGAWATASIACLCPACLAGPAILFGRGIYEEFKSPTKAQKLIMLTSGPP